MGSILVYPRADNRVPDGLMCCMALDYPTVSRTCGDETGPGPHSWPTFLTAPGILKF